MIPEGGSTGERVKALATEQELGWWKGTRDRLGFHGKKSCLLSLIRRSQRAGGFCTAYRCTRGVREMRDSYAKTIRWDVTWRAHSDETTREELALVIWHDHNDVVNWNVAF
jgi:hypothetical protein